MKGDLTRGSVFKQILLFSLPYLIGNLFQLLYNVVDMVVVGHFAGHLEYAAVGASASIVWFFSGGIQMLTAGFATVAASKFGEGDYEGLKRAFASSIKLCAVVSAVLTPLAIFLARPLLVLMKTPEDIIDSTHTYLICIFSAITVMVVFNLLSNLIRALGDSRTPLYFLIASCVINITLDTIFVAVFGLGTLGVGLATVIAQVCSVVMCIVYIVKKQKLLHIEKRHFASDMPLVRRLLSIGIPMALQNMIIAVGGIIVQIATNGFGTDFIAAQTSGAKVENLVSMPILSIGTALSVFIAQNNGAGKYKRVLTGIKAAFVFGLAWWIISSIILMPFGDDIVRLLAGSDLPIESVGNAHLYILINCVFSFLLVTIVVLKNVLQALERGILPLISGFVEIVGRMGTAVLVMSLTAALTVDYDTGYNILCFSNPAAWVVGLIVVIPGFIGSVLKLRRLSKTEDDELSLDLK